MRFLCPFCYEEIRNKKEFHYICTNVNHMTTEDDIPYSIYCGKDLSVDRPLQKNNHIVTSANPRDPVCDVCHAPLKRKLCPNCHNVLPYGIEDVDTQFFAILGPRGVGKSHYIAVLIDKLKKLSMEFHWTLTAIDTGVTERYKLNYYDPLFGQNKILPGTMRIINSRYEPLAYNLKLSNDKTIGLFFIDTAGEDLRSDENAYIIEKYISKASGIIYLVDPTQFSFVKNRIGSSNMYQADYTDTLSIINEVYHAGNGLKRSKKINIPIAIAITKCDVLVRDPTTPAEEEVLLGSDSAINYARQEAVFDNVNSTLINNELEDLLARITGGEFTTAVKNFFDEYRYFAVSALGSDPGGANSLSQGLTPIRVEDPMLWLLSETSHAIKVKKK